MAKMRMWNAKSIASAADLFEDVNESCGDENFRRCNIIAEACNGGRRDLDNRNYGNRTEAAPAARTDQTFARSDERQREDSEAGPTTSKTLMTTPACSAAALSTTRTEEEERNTRGLWDWGRYKLLVPSTRSIQSALSIVACLTIVLICRLWACLRNQLRSSLWIRNVCAKAEEILEFANYTSQQFDKPVGRTPTAELRGNTPSVKWTNVRTHLACRPNCTRSGRNHNMTIEVPADTGVDGLHPPALIVPRIGYSSFEYSTLGSCQFNINSAPSSDGEDLVYSDSAVYTDGELSSSNEAGTTPATPLLRRDSNSSDISTDGSVTETKEPNTELVAKIINQVEYLFSDDHLAKDGFLLKHVRRRSDGYVSLKLVAGLRKVKQISRDFAVIQTSLKTSAKLEVNPEGTKIRRVEALSTYLKSLPIASQNKKNSKCQSPVPASNATTTTAPATNPQPHPHPNALNSTTSNQKPPAPEKQQGPGLRRRGGSLPVPVVAPNGTCILPGHHVYSPHSPVGSPQKRYSRKTIAYLSPSGSPPNELLPTAIRPKSNSYCEGLTTTATMSPWLQRRKAASRTNSFGNTVLSTVIRQPRGPDGTRGFASVPRLIEAN